MECKSRASRLLVTGAIEKSFRLEPLSREGRLQFFYHCPQSALPVRDVVGKRKKEPHIEKNAENYCVECYQNNIVGFLKSQEKYLFLFTKCASREPALQRFRGKRFIVGYIMKERWLWRGSHYAVQGFTKMVPFEHAFPLATFGPRARHWRMKRFNQQDTSLVLEHLARAEDIRKACIREIQRLQEPVKPETRRCR